MEDSASHRILVIEDDLPTTETLRLYLEREGFEVDAAADGQTGLELAQWDRHALIVLDWMLPRLSGSEVCRAIRKRSNVPIVMLTARTTEDDRVQGLELGADDYITKPVTPRVLLARIKAQLREGAKSGTQNQNRLDFGSLVIDLDAQSTELAGQSITLSSGEFELLWALASQAGSEVKRDDLIKEIRGFDYDGFDRTIDVRISRLRKKLGDHSNPPKKIKTIWGKGYLFVKTAW